MDKDLPWSNKEDSDILEPCKLCRKESIAIGDKYCDTCYKELITNLFNLCK